MDWRSCSERAGTPALAAAAKEAVVVEARFSREGFVLRREKENRRLPPPAVGEVTAVVPGEVSNRMGTLNIPRERSAPPKDGRRCWSRCWRGVAVAAGSGESEDVVGAPARGEPLSG